MARRGAVPILARGHAFEKAHAPCRRSSGGPARNASAQPPRELAHPTIVSLNPCTDAHAGGTWPTPAQVLAISHYSRDPRASSMDLGDRAPLCRATGGTVEEVLALKPDLVVAGSFTAAGDQRRLSRGWESGSRPSGSQPAWPKARRRSPGWRALAGHAGRGAALNARIEAGARRGASAARRSAGQHAAVAARRDRRRARQPGRRTARADRLCQPCGGARAGAGGLSSARTGAGRSARAAAGRRAVSVRCAIRRCGRSAACAIARLEPALLYCGGPTIIRAARRAGARSRRAGRCVMTRAICMLLLALRCSPCRFRCWRGASGSILAHAQCRR